MSRLLCTYICIIQTHDYLSFYNIGSVPLDWLAQWLTELLKTNRDFINRSNLGCQIFLGARCQNRKKCTKTGKYIPNDHKVDQMAVN
jgi:hypothetical protein